MADKPINLDLRAKDNASRAMQSVQTRLLELQRGMDALRAKGNVNLTVADAGNMARMEREAKRLTVALQEIDTAGKKTANSLSSSFSNLQGALSQVGLGGLGGALSIAGGVGAAAVIGKTAVELGNLGAVALVTEKSFRAVTGAIGANANLLNQLSDAAGGTITQVRLMQLANTALAGASNELGNAFAAALPKLIEGARAANQLNPALGDTEFLFQSLVTGIKRGSPMLIDNTGITLKIGEANEKYAASIGKAVSQLTEEEQKLALLQATIAGVDRLIQQSGGNLENMAQSAGRLKTAWEELRTEMGKSLAPGVSEVQGGLADILRLLNDISRSSSTNPAERRGGLQAQKVAAENMLAQYNSVLSSGNAPPWSEFMRDMAIKAIREINAELAGLPPEFDAAGENSASAFASGISSGMRGVPDMFTDVAGAAVSNWNAQMGRLQLGPSPLRPKSEYEASFLGSAAPTANSEMFDLWLKDSQEATKQARDAELEAIRNTKTAWSSAASDAGKAFSDAVSGVAGELRSGMNVSKGLADYTKTGGAEDPNGWMKDIRRLQAWISDGSWGETAQKFGITDKGDAQERIRKFQMGQWDASVTALIDKDALTKQVQAQGAGQAFLDAFAADVAKASGENPAVVKAMLGFQGDKNGAGALDMKPLAQSVTSSFNTEVNAQSAEFVKAGNTMFSYVGQGFVDSAKSSGLLLQAVQAMVLSLLPKQ